MLQNTLDFKVNSNSLRTNRPYRDGKVGRWKLEILQNKQTQNYENY